MECSQCGNPAVVNIKGHLLCLNCSDKLQQLNAMEGIDIVDNSITGSSETKATLDLNMSQECNTPSIGTNNGFATISLIFGLLSIILSETIVIPLVAVVLGILGIGEYIPNIHKNRWMAIVGIVLGILYFAVGIYLNTR